MTLAVIVRHPLWGTIGLPIWSWLYVRKCDLAKIPAQSGWTFQTKLQQAADLALMAAETLQFLGKKQLWIVTDGAYAKRPFVRPVLDLGLTLVGRLRKDSALRDLPPKEHAKRRGRKRKYGVNRISLAKRAAQPRGWIDVTCTVYGQEEVKRVKTFLATHRTFGGAIRVVIVKEPHGPQFFYCTDVSANVREIIEAFADRSTIEQVFHDVKEVWGSGQQQVRNVWANIACWHLNLWLFTLVELWAWKKTAKQLTHRDDSPWEATETAERIARRKVEGGSLPVRGRPSHADRRKALQAECLANEFSATLPGGRIPRKIRETLKRLLRIAV